MPLSPDEKSKLLLNAFKPLIDQFSKTWKDLESKGVDYDSYVMAVWLFFATGVKNLSCHTGHMMAFLQIIAHELPGVQIVAMGDDEDDDAEADE